MVVVLLTLLLHPLELVLKVLVVVCGRLEGVKGVTTMRVLAPRVVMLFHIS